MSSHLVQILKIFLEVFSAKRSKCIVEITLCPIPAASFGLREDVEDKQRAEELKTLVKT